MTHSKALTMMVAMAVTAGCQKSPDDTAPRETPVTNFSVAAPASKPPQMIPKPAAVADVDRLILAGYTPHADHMHAPGVNECPMSKGNDVVM